MENAYWIGYQAGYNAGVHDGYAKAMAEMTGETQVSSSSVSLGIDDARKAGT